MDLSLFVSILAWFVAAFVSGLCGIGAAAIATAIQITVMPVQTVVLVSCLTGLSVGLVMSLRYFRYCRWKTAMLMFGGTIPGSLGGHPAVCSGPYPENFCGLHAHLLHSGHGPLQKR